MTSCLPIVDFSTLKSISSIHPSKIHSISQTIPGATVYYVQNIKNVAIRTQAIAVNQSTEKRGEILCKFCSDFKRWKCGSPEGGFAASCGDQYGLHSGAADKGPQYGMSSGYWGAFEKFGLGRR